MNQAELAGIHRRAEIAFARIPGVKGVGFGRKEVAGQVTDQMSLRVYVVEKKPVDELSPDEVIPASFEGIPTDVLVVRDVKRIPCEDEQTHSPLIGGISVSNCKGPGNTIEVGTLGFFATLDGVGGPDNVVLVSNNHVLAANGAVVGDTVYHPNWIDVNGVRTIVLQTGPIGKINSLGLDGTHNFTYPSEAAADYFLDCASAKLDISISSWCNTNCGVSYKNEIRGLNIGGNSRIESVARLAQVNLDAPGDYVVYKVGRRTSRTKGRVLDVAAVTVDGPRVIEIEATEPDCDSILRFAAKGDSGSAVINDQNQLVGLLFAISASDAKKAYACHIHPVMHKLGITPISVANPPVGPAGQARADLEGMFADGINHTIPLRERLLATPLGADVYARMLEHRAEVVGLVNHRRPVTVAWHRARGPAFLAHAINNVRDPDHRIPRTIEDVERAELIRRMADVLIEHGSPALGLAVREWLPFVLAHVDGADDLHALVARFEAETVHG